MAHPFARSVRRWLSLVLAPFSVAPASATTGSSNPPPPPTEYQWRTWTTDDGLPHNATTKVLQDSAGFMWFGTLGGLARFDGNEIREYALPSEYRTGRLSIRGLAEERPDVLVVVAASNTVLRLADGHWTAHPVNATLASFNDGPFDVYVDAGHNVWVATARSIVLRCAPDGNVRTYGSADAGLAPRSRTISFATGAEGGTWIAGDELWFVLADGTLSPGPRLESPPRLIAGRRSDRLWICDDQTLLRYENDELTLASPLPPRSEIGSLRHLFEDRSGSVWLATSRGGLIRFTQGKIERVEAYPTVTFVTQDREGSMWIATDGSGIGQLRERSYRVFDAAQGLGENVVSSMSEDSTGRVWLANRSGGLVSVGPDNAVERKPFVDPTVFANVVCVGNDDAVWYGGSNSGLHRWQPETATAVHLPVPAGNLHLLFRSRRGDMWFTAEPNQLGYYRGDAVRVLGAADGFPPQEIRAIAEDRDGNIWLGGRTGKLLRWTGASLETVVFPPEFPPTPIHAIYADADNRLWLGSTIGLIVKDGPSFHRLDERSGLADSIIQTIAEDRNGNLWCAARRGLFHVAKNDLLKAARDPAVQVESHRIGPARELRGLTPVSNYSPTACCTRNGLLWFATTLGAVVVDPRREFRPRPSPEVILDEVRVDDDLVRPAGPVKIPAGRHRIAFRFAVPTYVSVERPALRHQLEGADPSWVSTTRDFAASYTNLPPGTYRLRVNLRDGNGHWAPTAAAVDLTVLPAWWETLSFRVGTACAIVALLLWGARVALHRKLQRRLRLLEQQHALQAERARIARDLHDDLGASLTELGLIADRLAESAPSGFAAQVSGLGWRVRRVTTELSSIVWTMNDDHSSLHDLALFLRRYAERLFLRTSIRLTVKGADSIPRLPVVPAVQHHLLSAAKEALNNLVTHSQASEASLELRYADGVFTIAVTDNGAGFDPAMPSPRAGTGLRNMGTRMAEVGGRCEIASATSARAGTRVVLTVSVLAFSPI